MSDARQYDLFRARDNLWVGRNERIGADLVERLLDRGQISRAVIHNCDYQSNPLVLGSNRAFGGHASMRLVKREQMP